MELRQAKDQGIAILIERDGVVTGYAAGIGILGHAVARSNDDLKILLVRLQSLVLVSLPLLEITNYLIGYLKMAFKLVGQQIL
jgi:hypothetical protein